MGAIYEAEGDYWSGSWSDHIWSKIPTIVRTLQWALFQKGSNIQKRYWKLSDRVEIQIKKSETKIKKSEKSETKIKKSEKSEIRFEKNKVVGNVGRKVSGDQSRKSV